MHAERGENGKVAGRDNVPAARRTRTVEGVGEAAGGGHDAEACHRPGLPL